MNSDAIGPNAARIASLYCYPVKGLSPQRVETTLLRPGAYFPNDRLFAIENGPSGYIEASPAHLPKTRFLMLMRDEKLAQLDSFYDPETKRLTIGLEGRDVCDADLGSPEGRATLEAWFQAFCQDDLTGAPKLLSSQSDFRFTDSPQGYVSLVNLASVNALGAQLGREVDPLRFRANLYLEGLDQWGEAAFIGRRLRVGDTVLEVTSETERCAATSVNPQTAVRDMNVVKTLVRDFGHNACGVYGRVVEGGTIRPGDAVSLMN